MTAAIQCRNYLETGGSHVQCKRTAKVDFDGVIVCGYCANALRKANAAADRMMDEIVGAYIRMSSPESYAGMIDLIESEAVKHEQRDESPVDISGHLDDREPIADGIVYVPEGTYVDDTRGATTADALADAKARAAEQIAAMQAGEEYDPGADDGDVDGYYDGPPSL